MSLDNLTLRVVCESVRDARRSRYDQETMDLLIERTGESNANCLEAIRNAVRCGYIQCGGASGQCAVLTVAGEEFLANPEPERPAGFALLQLDNLRVRKFTSEYDLRDAIITLRDRDIQTVPLFYNAGAERYVVPEVMR